MEIARNLTEIKQRIMDAAKRSGRDFEEIKLLAVTKTHPTEKILEVINAGALCIGENKVQESLAKIPELEGKFEEFHFIGHLQTNKVKKIVALRPSLIHSVDSLHLAEKISSEAEKLGYNQDILLQVNTSGEESKFGVSPDKAFELAEAVSKLEHVKVKGLMTIGKFTDNEEEIRASFRLLKEIGKQLANIESIEIKWYSMGMTHDFEIAIEEGSNLVRIGTAIFGVRE